MMGPVPALFFSPEHPAATIQPQPLGARHGQTPAHHRGTLNHSKKNCSKLKCIVLAIVCMIVSTTNSATSRDFVGKQGKISITP